MNGISRNITATLSLCLLALAGLSGCANTASTIDTGADLAKATSAQTDNVVFGKFRLVRNGYEAKLGTSVFANSATLHLYQQDGNEKFVGKVGSDGDFAWVLKPGSYRVSSIGFYNRGDKVEPVTNFTFTVPADHDAIYVGTITLETTFDSGFLGVNGTVDRYTVANDCATDCAPRLEQLGLAETGATVSLMQDNSHFARRN
jgi:hypothetical protein